MSRSPPCRKTLIQTEEILGRRAGYIERCKSGSEGGTRHTYWVNGPYPTACHVGGWLAIFGEHTYGIPRQTATELLKAWRTKRAKRESTRVQNTALLWGGEQSMVDITRGHAYDATDSR